MAAFLDLSFFEGLKPLWVFLIIFSLVYALLNSSKVFGENKSIKAIIAAVIGILMILAKKVMLVITTLIPWFILLAVFIILIVIALKTMGISDDAVSSAVKDPTVYYAVIIIGLILLVGSLGYVFGQEELGVTSENTSQVTFSGGDGNGNISSSDTGDFQTNAKATIYHPRVLGFIMMIVITLFAVQQLSKTNV